jgi:hypothetical protein
MLEGADEILDQIGTRGGSYNVFLQRPIESS